MLKKEDYLKTVRRPYPPLFCTLVCMGYTNKKFYEGIVNEPFAITNLAHVDNVWYYGKAEMEKGGKLALEAWKNPKTLDHVKREFKRREENLVNSATKSVEEFAKAYQEYMPALALIFTIDKPTEQALREALSTKLRPEEINELMSELNIPLEDNFHKKEEYDLLTTNDLAGHVKKYAFLYARYGEDRTYTVEEAKDKLKEIDKKEFLKKWEENKEKLKTSIVEAKQLLGDKSYLVDIFQYMIFYRTHRTDIMNKAAFFAIPMLKKIAENNKISYEQLIRCSAQELLENKVPSEEVLGMRIKDCSTLLDRGKISLLIGKESQKLIDFFKEEINEINEFKGNIACKGKVRGKAKLIFDKKDFEKVKDGDILVTSMTTPEMIPAMKKAIAFVTDEGGVTCHAAIISREMNKPCIIGTKIATRALKDNNEIEVDANMGIIKVLKR